MKLDFGSAGGLQAITSLIELGVQIVKRKREIDGAPADDVLTADEVRAIPIGDVDDLIEQGRAKARGGG